MDAARLKIWQGFAVMIAIVLGFLLGGLASERSSVQSDQVAEGIEEALAMHPSLERTELLVSALRALDSTNALAVAEVLSDGSSDANQYEVRLFAGEWATFEPETALKETLAWNGTLERLSATAEVLRVWAGDQPVQARQAYNSRIDEMEKDKATFASALVLGWVDSGYDPDGLLPVLISLEDWDREKATRLLLDGLVKRGEVELAFAFADSLPEELPFGFRHVVFRKLSLVIGPSDPERVARWLEPYRSMRYGQSGLRILARTWAKKDPEAALTWAINQPDDRGRFLSVKFAFDSWYQEDPEAALAWIESIDEGINLDGAYLMIALEGKDAGMMDAARSALRIQDVWLRADTLGQTHKKWAGLDPEAARAWLESDEVTEENRQGLAAWQRGELTAGGPRTAPPQEAELP